MLSVIIPTSNSERLLAPNLTALVPGAVAGIVSEAIIADLGSTDGTLRIADAAGCVVVSSPSRAGALRAGAAAARAPWLMFVRPGFVPDAQWTHAVPRFLETAADDDASAATFARAIGAGAERSTPREIVALAAALIRRPLDPGQGLVISRRRYEMLGGHRDAARDCEADLMRRIGRNRITVLDCGGTRPPR
jgi:glycosyltransferase involved in cell wall biosynthesis